METQNTLGARFATALSAKDSNGLLELLHPEIDFRGMTPGRTWEPGGPQEVLSVLLDNWFDDSDQIEGVERIESDAFADRQRVEYRFRVRNPDGLFLVEQTAYLSDREGQIDWMRVLCSGYRPAG